MIPLCLSNREAKAVLVGFSVTTVPIAQGGAYTCQYDEDRPETAHRL